LAFQFELAETDPKQESDPQTNGNTWVQYGGQNQEHASQNAKAIDWSDMHSKLSSEVSLFTSHDEFPL